MRTRIFWTNEEGPQEGLLTDTDIYAVEGQEIELNKSAYYIDQIKFKMIAIGSNISTEKQLYLGEVEKHE